MMTNRLTNVYLDTYEMQILVNGIHNEIKVLKTLEKKGYDNHDEIEYYEERLLNYLNKLDNANIEWFLDTRSDFYIIIH